MSDDYDYENDEDLYGNDDDYWYNESPSDVIRGSLFGSDGRCGGCGRENADCECDMRSDEDLF